MTEKLKSIAPIFGKFLMVGLSGTVVNLAFLWLFVQMGLNHLVADVLATEISIINNFVWNELFTFRKQSTTEKTALWSRFLRFQCVTSITALLTLGLFSLFIALHIFYLLAQFIAIGISTMINFGANSWLTWGLFKKNTTATPELQPEAAIITQPAID